ncbi:hypothetical protein RDI58_003478 [Solanum bulbocastanum]|uniref:Uncharacterized protein n=1 Tax=Solanum bulbocastanum TaxID=147425 RepID=A0AAN8YPU9_SOLBU
MVAFASSCCSVHMSSTCHTLHRELEGVGRAKIQEFLNVSYSFSSQLQLQIRRDIGETEAHSKRMLLEPKRV